MERDLCWRDAGHRAAAARAARRIPLLRLLHTNPAHVAHFSHHHAELLRAFRELFVSSTIGLRKPDAESYDHVVQRIGVPAGRIVFFDDLIENIEGARARGLIGGAGAQLRRRAEALDALGL